MFENIFDVVCSTRSCGFLEHWDILLIRNIMDYVTDGPRITHYFKMSEFCHVLVKLRKIERHKYNLAFTCLPFLFMKYLSFLEKLLFHIYFGKFIPKCLKRRIRLQKCSRFLQFISDFAGLYPNTVIWISTFLCLYRSSGI